MKIPSMKRGQGITINPSTLIGLEEVQTGKGCSAEAMEMFARMLQNPDISPKARQYAEDMLVLHRTRLGHH